MQIAARLAARKPSLLVALFWWLATALVGALVSIAAWNFVTDLMARYPVLGLGDDGADRGLSAGAGADVPCARWRHLAGWRGWTGCATTPAEALAQEDLSGGTGRDGPAWCGCTRARGHPLGP